MLTQWSLKEESPYFSAGLLSSLKMVVRRDQAISPPGQEGIKGWSIETAKKHSNTAIYRKVGDQPPLSPPVQEGNLNCQAEENLTALPYFSGGSVNYRTSTIFRVSVAPAASRRQK